MNQNREARSSVREGGSGRGFCQRGRFWYAVIAVLPLMGCGQGELSRELSATAEDGSTVVVSLTLRHNGCVDDDGPQDCYYYRVRLSPASPFDPNLRTRERARIHLQEQLERQRDLLSDAEEALAEGISLADIERIAENEFGFSSLEDLRSANDSLASRLAGGVCDVSSRLEIRFYDEAGFSLYLDRFAGSDSRNALSPGWNDVPDEVTRSDGDWLWVGRFGAEVLAPSQFERLSTISVRLVPPDGCP